MKSGSIVVLAATIALTGAVATPRAQTSPRFNTCPPTENIAWSVITAMRGRYGPLTETQRRFTLNVRGELDPNGGFIRERGGLFLVQPISEWRPVHLPYVDFADLDALMVLAAGERYKTLEKILPPAFGSPKAFGAAILQEWYRRGYQINPRFLPGYVDDDPDGQPRYCPGFGPQSRPAAPSGTLRPLPPGIG